MAEEIKNIETENEETKVDKVKGFLKTNWKNLLCAAGGAVVGAFGMYLKMVDHGMGEALAENPISFGEEEIAELETMEQLDD